MSSPSGKHGGFVPLGSTCACSHTWGQRSGCLLQMAQTASSQPCLLTCWPPGPFLVLTQHGPIAPSCLSPLILTPAQQKPPVSSWEGLPSTLQLAWPGLDSRPVSGCSACLGWLSLGSAQCVNCQCGTPGTPRAEFSGMYNSSAFPPNEVSTPSKVNVMGPLQQQRSASGHTLGCCSKTQYPRLDSPLRYRATCIPEQSRVNSIGV